MDPESLLATLIEDGVLEDAGGETLELTAEFRDRVAERRAALTSLDGTERANELEESVGATAAEFLASDVDDPAFLARCWALSNATALTGAELVRVGLVLDRFLDAVETDGAPDAFLPVRGDRLSAALALHPAAIVYVWRHDCPACDTMRESLDEVYPEPPAEISLFAVYGPEWPELLEDEYGVVGGPTTLFVLDGAVDSRLHGAHAPDVVESEADIVIEAARA